MYEIFFYNMSQSGRHSSAVQHRHGKKVTGSIPGLWAFYVELSCSPCVCKFSKCSSHSPETCMQAKLRLVYFNCLGFTSLIPMHNLMGHYPFNLEFTHLYTCVTL